MALPFQGNYAGPYKKTKLQPRVGSYDWNHRCLGKYWPKWRIKGNRGIIFSAVHNTNHIKIKTQKAQGPNVIIKRVSIDIDISIDKNRLLKVGYVPNTKPASFFISLFIFVAAIYSGNETNKAGGTRH